MIVNHVFGLTQPGLSLNDTSTGSSVGSLSPVAPPCKHHRGLLEGNPLLAGERVSHFPLGGNVFIYRFRESDQVVIRFLLYNSIIEKSVADQ